MTNASNHGEVAGADHSPPLNEVPVPVAAAVVWRSAGMVVAIPALLVYTVGVEMSILCRTREKKPNLTQDQVSAQLDSMRNWYRKLNGLTINGTSVELLDAQYFDSGFNAHAWSSFVTHKIEPAGGEMRLEINWPEFDPAVYILRGVRQESIRSELLWTSR